MSLDIYVHATSNEAHSGIFIRENGEIKEISREEWDAKYPGREPTIAKFANDNIYSFNITHNLGKMAAEVGLYESLWRHETWQTEGTCAELIEPLVNGLVVLQADPVKYKAFNPSNGWGSYDGLVDVLQRLLDVCIRHPEAQVSTSK